MAVSGVEAVLEFLIKNGFAEAESALRDDIVERGELGSFDFEKFMFPITALPPPVKITVGGRQSEVSEGVDCSGSSSYSSHDFVSVDSSTTDVSHSGFTNPYGLWSAAEVKSEASSDRPSEFGTAREYPDSDMLNDMYWCDENDEGCPMYPCFRESDVFSCPSEDKFVMTSEVERQWDNNLPLNAKLEEFHTATRINYLDKPCIANSTKNYVVKEFPLNEYCHWDENVLPEHGMEEESVPNCDCCVGEKRFHGQNSEDYNHLESLKEPELSNFQLKILCESPFDCDPASEHKISTSSDHSFKKHDLDMESQNYPGLNFQADEKAFQPNEDIGCEIADGAEMDGRTHQPAATGEEEEGITANELPICSINEDEFEIFELRIIHRKNRTGFEEHKDLPIVLNAIVAGRYYVTEYLGSAAFSKVVQAHDLHTGMDVCLKIIKNDKDFFDQSLDEIKLLKFVNKHDPADEHHILRLYDYFYHQEHLFIVCELLHANLYEFQKFNQDSGGEAYFTMHRLQVITRQCLEALEYLHNLGIMHCDLKPENILMKSYRRCEIKVIDLGSSCFQTDNLCLYVQSRSYRAPEVILGLPYDQKIDIWSLGCILAELCSGEVLFPNDALVMLLARIIGMLGPIDMEMLVGGQETQNYFTEEYDLYHLNEETNQVEYIIPEESSLERHLRVSDTGFIEFIKDMLELNPRRRLTAREALEHPWLSYPYEPNCS